MTEREKLTKLINELEEERRVLAMVMEVEYTPHALEVLKRIDGRLASILNMSQRRVQQARIEEES
jgi:hypothetical protein